MQTPTRETTEQNSGTASDPGLNFKWPARLVLKSSNLLLCCASDPPIKGKMPGVLTPVEGASSGTCNFSVPASQLPGLGELAVQITVSPIALQLTFFQGSNLIGVYAGSISGGGAGTGGGTCRFEFGTC